MMNDTFSPSSPKNGPFLGNRPNLNERGPVRAGPSAIFKQVSVVDSSTPVKSKESNLEGPSNEINATGWQAPPVTRGMKMR